MTKSKRKIAVVTGTRAEYGLLYWIIKGIHEDRGLELQLIATGMHLSAEFGNTVKEIEKDGFPIADRVEMLLSSDSGVSTAISMGVGITGFARTYERLGPDIILVLGDRFEIFSAVAAAVPLRIPVAHIHGGEATEGVMDEQFRHAVTKMSSIHFPATKRYAGRIIQMGERPERVYCFGAPGLDNIYKLKLLNRKEIIRELSLPIKGKTGVVTFHPEIIDNFPVEFQVKELLRALTETRGIFWVITMPNADPGGRSIQALLDRFALKNNARAKTFPSLGQLRYLSLLKHADLMVGNSSSGIVEAPSFRLPVVNIGDRQGGRVRSVNIIDVPVCRKRGIIEAIEKAMSDDFKGSLRGLKNPYGRGNASEKIVSVLKKINLRGIVKKQFYEVPEQR
ncbi:MAG TPA: UDP-N-acetylglucosamine 2-epimerase [Syntrophorhabdaceae bacterium]|nr:UDP-N-acetylglucosamine 2-epimerase [Syntrophorhabdaceae bacterium]HQM80940.1 UDP-N-acetylglucosamine 2-epimerase [Syntrophorhabdaceae bacterium]